MAELPLRAHRYLVQWKGYKPEWESMRPKGKPGMFGMPGTPLITWEPAVNVEHTEASRRWWEETEAEEKAYKARARAKRCAAQAASKAKRAASSSTASSSAAISVVVALGSSDGANAMRARAAQQPAPIAMPQSEPGRTQLMDAWCASTDGSECQQN